MPILQMVGGGILLSFVQAIKALMSMSKSAFLEAMKSEVLNTWTTTSTCDRYGRYTGIFLCWYMFTLHNHTGTMLLVHSDFWNLD